ncbi:MAG: choice-of-anchor D domain-containing protein [Acidobacteriales bacterium]|nr:choice-of-anchor D domain-containing protein [Terriglobales bacterium]
MDSANILPDTVALTGVGVNPTVTLTPVSLAFGSQQVGTSSAQQKITLLNTGTGSLFINSIVLGGTNPQDYSEFDNCPIGTGGLNPNLSCVLTVTFTPTASGSRVATILVTDNAKNSPQTAYLSGNGTNFTVTLTPGTMTFGNQVVGTQSTAKIATLTNKGTTTLNISSVVLVGANLGDYQQSNTCGKSVPPAGICTINVTFAPTATGTRVATLQVNDNGYQGPQSISISGTAVQPVVVLSPTSLTYTLQQINTSSKTQKITLSNTGSGALTITTIAVGGLNLADFTQTNSCPTSGQLAAGKSCSITVTFTPKAAGTRTAAINISDNAPGAPHSVPLTGIGTAVTVTPASLIFGVITVGRSSQAKTVIVTNLGSSSLTISGINVSGANAGEFPQTNTCGSSLAAGASCTVTLTFIPTAVGARAATLNVNDPDPGGPQTVSLTGTGI